MVEFDTGQFNELVEEFTPNTEPAIESFQRRQNIQQKKDVSSLQQIQALSGTSRGGVEQGALKDLFLEGQDRLADQTSVLQANAKATGQQMASNFMGIQQNQEQIDLAKTQNDQNNFNNISTGFQNDGYTAEEANEMAKTEYEKIYGEPFGSPSSTPGEADDGTSVDQGGWTAEQQSTHTTFNRFKLPIVNEDGTYTQTENSIAQSLDEGNYFDAYTKAVAGAQEQQTNINPNDILNVGLDKYTREKFKKTLDRTTAQEKGMAVQAVFAPQLQKAGDNIKTQLGKLNAIVGKTTGDVLSQTVGAVDSVQAMSNDLSTLVAGDTGMMDALTKQANTRFTFTPYIDGGDVTLNLDEAYDYFVRGLPISKVEEAKSKSAQRRSINGNFLGGIRQPGQGGGIF